MADGPIAYVEMPSGLHVYRASAFMQCDQALMYALHGVPGEAPPASMQKVFDEGHENEDRIISMLCKETGMETTGEDAQRTVEIRVANAVVRGHIDEVGKHGPHRYLIEAKALGDDLYGQWVKAGDTASRWPKGELWEKYAMQFSVYGLGLGLPGCLVCGHKTDVVGEDGVTRREVTEINYRWFDPLPRTHADIALRLLYLESVAKGGLPQEDCSKGDWPCAYYKFHKEKPADDVVDGDAKLTELMREVMVKRAYAKAPTEAVDLAEKALKAYIQEIGRANAGMVTRGGGLQVKWFTEKVEGGTFERKSFTKNYYKLTKVKGS